MRRTKQTTVLALTGAVALASGAYALGSQAGDGSAEAAKNPANTAPQGYGGRPFGGPPGRFRAGPPNLQSLADRLGVKEADLQAALEDIRKSLPDRRDELAKELADALGIDVAKVTAAFDKLGPHRPDHPRGDFAAALAKKLGLSTAEVQKALDQQRTTRGGPRALAKALGVSPEKLRQAFAQLWRSRPHPPAHARDHRPDLAGLAKALGVTQAKLEAAFDKLKAAHAGDRDKLRDEFAQQLADRLHIDVQKVKDALDDFRPPFGGGHHP